jgi:hypothetical protein
LGCLNCSTPSSIPEKTKRSKPGLKQINRPAGQHIYLVAPLRCATHNQAALLPEYNPDFVHLVALLCRATQSQAAQLPGLLLTNSQTLIIMYVNQNHSICEISRKI